MVNFKSWVRPFLAYFVNTGFKGKTVRQTTDRVIIDEWIIDAAGQPITSGTTTLYLYELQNDGSYLSYDFNDNTFKSTALTSETTTMTHQKGNNNTTNTGRWTKVLSTLTGFTVGAMYRYRITNANIYPDKWGEFQFGDLEGDVTSGIAGIVGSTHTTTSISSTSTSLSTTSNEYNGSVMLMTSGVNKGVCRKISSSSYATGTTTFTFSGASGAADGPWPQACSAADTFQILGRMA